MYYNYPDALCKVNKLTQIRESLNLTMTDFGRQFLGIEDGKKAYDAVYQLEHRKNINSSTNLAYSLLYHAISAKEREIKGADKFLEYVFEQIQDNALLNKANERLNDGKKPVKVNLDDL